MLGIIVPTLGTRVNELVRLFESLDFQNNKRFYLVVIVQDCFSLDTKIFSKFNFDFNFYFISKRGISHSRNIAFSYLKPDTSFVTFGDDDCWYPPDMVSRINSLNLNSSICYCFKIHDPIHKLDYKKYYKKEIKKLSKFQLLRVSSIEIFVPFSIFNNKIFFDEQFGLGTENPSGEENIFLYDLVKMNVSVNFIPEIIVFHSFPDWINKEYIFKGKGALFSRLFGKYLAIIVISVYSFIKFRYFTDFSIQFSAMLKEAFKK